jgi:uncharacterized protein YpbB
LIVSQIINGTELFDLRAVRTTVETERGKLLLEIDPAPVVSKPAKKKSREKRNKEGDKSTYDVTLDYFKSGLKPEDIAKERGLTLGTIEGHLAKAVETARLDIDAFMPKAEVDEIMNAIEELPESFVSKELYDKLNGKFGYGKLKAVMAHVKVQGKK